MALDIISTINLDLKRPNTETVYAVQYDTAGRIKAQLTNDGEAWHVPSSAGGMVSFRKSDNIGGFYDTTELGEVAVSVDENDDSVIYIALDAQTTITATPLDHPVQMQINFYNSQGKRLSTFAFYLRVQASVLFDGDQDERPVASEWTFRILTGALGQTIKNQEEAIKWMEDNIRTQAGYVVDDTLKVEGAAGDAKKIGELFEEIVKISDSMPGYFPTTDTARVGSTKYYTRSGTAPNYVYTEFTGATFATGVTYYEYSPWNRIWIDPDDNDVAIPTMDDHNELSRQLSDVEENQIPELKSAISDITGNVAFTIWKDGYINCSNATVDITDIRTGQYKHEIIDCSDGDVFTISGQSYGAVARLWCFISADGTNLLAETANVTVNDKIITAPSNATKLIINWSYVSYATPNNIVTIFSGKLIKNTVSENTEQINIMKTHYENGNLFDRSKAHDGYTININGLEEEYRGACSSDYINLKAGTYCYETAPLIYGSNAKYIPTYTQADAFVSNVEGTLDGNIVKFTLSADSRIKLKLASATYQQAMLVNGNVYPETYIPYIDGVFLSDNVKVKVKNIIPEIVENNPLYGKKVIFDGDSICHGTSVGRSSPYYGWGYAGRIGTANEMVWHNVAQSGATITHGLKFSDNTDRHWISSYIDTIYASYPDADYIILEGGTNDADLLNTDSEKTGEVSQTKFTNFDYDIYSDALDYLFYNALNKFPNAKIGFIVAQKMGIVSRYDSQFYRRRFFDMAIETCKKWSIPYIDLWNESGLHPKVPSQYTAGASTNLYTDGQHLTDAGYDMISPKIEAWMKTL